MIADAQPRTLEGMQHRHTRYEVILEFAGRRVRRIGFARKSGNGLIDMARAHGAEISAMLTDAELDAPYRKTAASLTIGRAVLRFTGRTERDCAMVTA